MKRHQTVEEFLAGLDRWQEEVVWLREILLSTRLEEGIKWGAPCYMHRGKNLVGLGAFKSYFGLWFFQGALLPDPHGVLVNAQSGKTKALRQWRFESGEEIKAYIVLEDGVDGISKDEIMAWCRERMAAYKYPRIVEFRDSLPMNATGKILKRELRAEEEEKVAAGKSGDRD